VTVTGKEKGRKFGEKAETRLESVTPVQRKREVRALRNQYLSGKERITESVILNLVKMHGQDTKKTYPMFE